MLSYNLVQPTVHKFIMLLAKVIELLTVESPTEETIDSIENKSFAHHEALLVANGM